MIAALGCLATLAEGAAGWRLGLGTMVPLDEPPTVTVERRWGGYNVRVYNFSAEPLLFSGYAARTPLMLWETRVNLNESHFRLSSRARGTRAWQRAAPAR